MIFTQFMQQQYIFLNIKRLPEWYYLATSGQVQWLVAQWKTFEETIEIAQDLAETLLRAQKKDLAEKSAENFVYPMLVSV